MSQIKLLSLRGTPTSAFVLLELMVSVLLISMTMATIASTYVRTAKILSASRQIAAASQVLQQRIEMARAQTWDRISSSDALSILLQRATNSEAELGGADMVEKLRVTVAKSSESGLAETEQSISLTRKDGQVTVDHEGDFDSESTLLFEGTLTWRGPDGERERVLRTVVSRNGLTRSGIVGTVLGRSDSRTKKP